jgi:homoserine dehydrogenase
MKELKLALVGFGNVGKALVRLLETKRASLNRDFDINTKVVAIATGRHGIALDPIGINIEKGYRLLRIWSLLANSLLLCPARYVMELIHTCGADAVREFPRQPSQRTARHRPT